MRPPENVAVGANWLVFYGSTNRAQGEQIPVIVYGTTMRCGIWVDLRSVIDILSKKARRQGTDVQMQTVVCRSGKDSHTMVQSGAPISHTAIPDLKPANAVAR